MVDKDLIDLFNDFGTSDGEFRQTNMRNTSGKMEIFLDQNGQPTDR